MTERPLPPEIMDLEAAREEAASTEIVEWELPIEFDGYDVPPFPIEALPRVLGDYVRELAATNQVPLDIPACAALGTLHAAIARKVEVQIGETHREPLNIYLAPTAGSGERKRVIRDLVEPLYEAERRLRLEMKPKIEEAQGRRAVADERIRHLEKAAGKEDDPTKRNRLIADLTTLRAELPVVPAVPQLIADDTTAENLGRLMAGQDERMAVLRAERAEEETAAAT